MRLTGKQFRTSKRKDQGEAFGEWSVRLRGYFERWLEAEKVSVESKAFFDLLLREQLLDSCPADMRTWLREKKPKDVE